MKKTLIFLSILAILACHKKTTEPAVAPKPLPEKPFPTAEAAQIPKKEQLDPRGRVLASIKKTACFGECPVWSATIWSDGHAEFLGEKWAKRQGKFSAIVKQNWLKELLANAESSGFFALAPYYPTTHTEITDLPTTFIFVESKGRFHQIENHFDAPLALRNFEILFEKKLEELDWKP